jgi:SAM-dependent methyltransferase
VERTAPVTPTSITHQHLLAIVNSELRRWPDGTPIRILDVGCGTGRLLALLADQLPKRRAGLSFELYGIDVGDHGVQPRGCTDRTVDFLGSAAPGHPWRERIHVIGETDPWPFASEWFHVVVSNQVLEHVRDHASFLREVRRTLRAEGMSAHVFPLRHVLIEAHLNLPLVHWIRNTDLLRAYVRALSRAGLGKFPEHRRASGVTLDEFVERHADYMHYFTNYLTQREILRLAKQERLRPSFRYTPGFYGTKLRSLAHLRAPLVYRSDRWRVFDALAVFFLRYVSSVTLILEKAETYTAA